MTKLIHVAPGTMKLQMKSGRSAQWAMRRAVPPCRSAMWWMGSSPSMRSTATRSITGSSAGTLSASSMYVLPRTRRFVAGGDE